MDELVDERVSMSAGDMNDKSSSYSNTKASSQDDDQPCTVSDHTKDCSDVIRGYIDCAQEAIRFLTENGGMSIDHPFINSLQACLLKHIYILQIQLLINEVINLGSEDHQDAYLVPKQLQEFDKWSLSPQASFDQVFDKIHGSEKNESEISDVEISHDEGFHET